MKKKAFTVIELLVIVAIIAMLIAIVSSGFNKKDTTLKSPITGPVTEKTIQNDSITESQLNQWDVESESTSSAINGERVRKLVNEIRKERGLK